MVKLEANLHVPKSSLGVPFVENQPDWKFFLHCHRFFFINPTIFVRSLIFFGKSVWLYRACKVAFRLIINWAYSDFYNDTLAVRYLMSFSLLKRQHKWIPQYKRPAKLEIKR